MFIEETGKTGVTSLVDLAPANRLLKLAPGHPVILKPQSGILTVSDSEGNYVGHVDPRLASRLIRLLKGGNRYEVTVTHVGERELTVIIRETYKDPSQGNDPFRSPADRRRVAPKRTIERSRRGHPLESQRTRTERKG